MYWFGSLKERPVLAVPGPVFPVCSTLPTICGANEGPVIIQYKCLVPIYVFPEMKLLFSKQNYNVRSPSSYTHISVRDLYISWIGLPHKIIKRMNGK